MNSLPKTVTRQHRSCNLNPGPTVPKSNTLTTWLLTTLFSLLSVFIAVCATITLCMRIARAVSGFMLLTNDDL